MFLFGLLTILLRWVTGFINALIRWEKANFGYEKKWWDTELLNFIGQNEIIIEAIIIVLDICLIGIVYWIYKKYKGKEWILAIIAQVFLVIYDLYIMIDKYFFYNTYNSMWYNVAFFMEISKLLTAIFIIFILIKSINWLRPKFLCVILLLYPIFLLWRFISIELCFSYEGLKNRFFPIPSTLYFYQYISNTDVLEAFLFGLYCFFLIVVLRECYKNRHLQLSI